MAWGGLAQIVMPAVTKAQYTPIDAFGLFDKVLLHEVYSILFILVYEVALTGRVVDTHEAVRWEPKRYNCGYEPSAIW